MNKLSTIVFAFVLLLGTVGSASSQVESSVYSEAQSAILSASSAAAKISGLRNVPSVGVIRVQNGFVPRFSQDGENVSTLLVYASRNQAGIKKLRSNLLANPVMRKVMAQHGISVGHVIGVTIGSEGSLRFFVS